MVDFFHHQSLDILVYRGTPFDLHRITSALPDARRVNGELVGVPRTLRNSQVLRLLGLPVVPIIEDYDWPIRPGRKVLAHQKLYSNFMVLHPRCFNLGDMGTMKTNAALWSADWIMLQQGGKALIVCPLSIMQTGWANAIFADLMGRRTCVILHGDAEKRRKLLDTDVDFYIVNHDGVGIGAHTRKKFELDGFSKALAERQDIKIAIIDEASAYKDAQTKRNRIARLVFGQKPYLWLMTGTPTPNAPTDAYGLAKLVNNAFGKSFTTFRQETMLQLNQFKWISQKDGYDKARKLLSPSIRFDIKDVWDGPELTTQQREVPLTTDQKRLMTDLKRDLQVVVRSGEPITAVNEAAARQKFIQISLGAIYDKDHNWHAIDSEPRIEELKSIIEQAPGKILVFIPLTSVIHMIHKNLTMVSREIVNGEVGQKDRARIFQDFQTQPNPRVLLADPGTTSHGLDLWAATTVVWYGTTEKPELYAQANRRAHRPGQHFPVTIVQLVSNPLEKEIFRRLENSLSLQGALLDAIKEGTL